MPSPLLIADAPIVLRCFKHSDLGHMITGVTLQYMLPGCAHHSHSSDRTDSSIQRPLRNVLPAQFIY